MEDIRKAMWKRKEKQLWAEASRDSFKGNFIEFVFRIRYCQEKAKIFGGDWRELLSQM